jgi:hypothetical protein
MSRAFEQVIALQLERFGPEAARLKHIEIARAGLAAFMARQTAKPDVQIIVDGRPAASEDVVRPFGVISYRFIRIRPACLFALAEAQRMSPVGHDPGAGKFKASWFFLVDDQETAGEAIPNNARQVYLTNDQPYARKINVGSKGFERYAPPGICERVAALVRQRYGATVDAKIEFLTLGGGYRLKRPIRRGRQVQHDLTYPAVKITPKGLV